MADRVWLTLTTKPIGVASREQLKAVEASVELKGLSEAMLLALISEAVKQLEENSEDN